MKYTEIVVLFLNLLREEAGSFVGRIVTLKQLSQAMEKIDPSITERLVKLATEELIDQRLIKANDIKVLGRGDVLYAGLDITGSGLRLLESLDANAAAEGKKEPWLWSMVEKAGTLANLVHIAVQIARGS